MRDWGAERIHFFFGKGNNRLRCVCFGPKEEEEMQLNKESFGVGNLVSFQAIMDLQWNSSLELDT